MSRCLLVKIHICQTSFALAFDYIVFSDLAGFSGGEHDAAAAASAAAARAAIVVDGQEAEEAAGAVFSRWARPGSAAAGAGASGTRLRSTFLLRRRMGL